VVAERVGVGKKGPEEKKKKRGETGQYGSIGWGDEAFAPKAGRGEQVGIKSGAKNSAGLLWKTQNVKKSR